MNTNFKFLFYDIDLKESFYFPVNKGSFIDPKIEYHRFTKNTVFSAIDETNNASYNFNLNDEVFLNDPSYERFNDGFTWDEIKTMLENHNKINP